MKQSKLTKKIVIQAAALLVFFAVSLSSIFYALGYFELPYIRRGKEHSPHRIPDVGPAEDSLKALETGQNVSGIGVDSHPSEQSRTPADTGTPERRNDPVAETVDASALAAKGYSVTYDSYDGAVMKLGLVYASSALPAAKDLGHKKTVTEIREIRYEESGTQFANPVQTSVLRNAVELYMGYILLDSGAGECTALFPTEGSDGAAGERKKMRSDKTLTVRDSLGSLIGVYPADDVVPAYTRDTQNRALFLYKGQYYYLNDATGDFLLSDYVDVRDNRGLYYDYAPTFGAPDNNLKKWAVETPVTLHYEVDTYLIYARYGVDWRVARELYMLDQKYAELVASQYGRGKYYNAAFAGRLAIEKANLRAEGWKPPVTTLAPITTSSPETSGTPGTSSGICEDVTAPSGAVSSGAANTVPGESVQTAPVPETPSEITVSAILEPSPLLAAPQTNASSGTESSGSSVGSSAAETSAAATAAAKTSAKTAEGSTAEPVSTEPPHVILKFDITNPAYRFLFASAQPALNSSAVQYTTMGISSYIVETFSWNTQYKYAKAFNFRGGRAVTVDDNDVLRIINTSAATSVRLDRNYYNTDLQDYVREYYTEPFWKDLRSAGHYFYDNGLLRVRRIESLSYMRNYYNVDEDCLIDIYGNRYTLPNGYSLCAYSEGILILERNGLYGCYHKDGYWIAQPIYTSAEPFVEGLCVLTLSDGTKGMIDTRGNVILPFRYEEISNASTGVISCYSPADGWTVLAKMRK